jgi:hypothetical protein
MTLVGPVHQTLNTSGTVGSEAGALRVGGSARSRCGVQAARLLRAPASLRDTVVLKVCATHGLWEPPPPRCPRCQREKDQRRRATGGAGWGDGRDRATQARFRREVIAL